jgi:hypothetical protein
MFLLKMFFSEFSRPHNLLVFINPVGGKGRAKRIYSKKVAPIFELAGISSEVITTVRQNHARDTLREYDLSKVDGVVSIGGDGMFTEILHGLMARTLADNNIDQLTPETVLPRPSLRVGIIPAGMRLFGKEILDVQLFMLHLQGRRTQLLGPHLEQEMPPLLLYTSLSVRFFLHPCAICIFFGFR